MGAFEFDSKADLSARSCNFCTLRAPSTTFAPCAAYTFAIASPIPDDAPVMTITLFANVFISFLFMFCISARRFRGVPPHLQVRPRPRLDGNLPHAAGMRA